MLKIAPAGGAKLSFNLKCRRGEKRHTKIFAEGEPDLNVRGRAGREARGYFSRTLKR
jgi:hypothetical protein